jgi:hypothetical protein
MRTIGMSLVIVFLVIGSLPAQDATRQAVPAPDAHVIRVHLGDGGGMYCCPGYCTSLTTVDPSFIIRELSNSSCPKKFPSRKQKQRITRKDWERVERAIDSKSLAATPQVQCYAIIDLPCSSAQVEFSDGTKIEISYDNMKPAPAVAALLRSIQAIPGRPFLMPAQP